MVKHWDTYTRQTIELASAATYLGFSAVKTTTRLGFALTRGIATTAVGVTTAILDHTLFGGSTVTSPLLGSAVSFILTIAEQITLAPIFLSEYITTTSLIAAHSSISVLSLFFPGSSDASFSLASFISLVRREWAGTPTDAHSPARQFGFTQIARAVVAWVVLQGVTQEWQERRWFQYLREIDVNEPPKHQPPLSRRNSRVRVTSDVIVPGNMGHIISADIGEAPPRTRTPSAVTVSPKLRSSTLSLTPLTSTNRRSLPPNGSPILSPLPFPHSHPHSYSHPHPHSYPNSHTHSHVHAHAHAPHSHASHVYDTPFSVFGPPSLSNHELKSTLRRLSKLVVAGYGGASLLFFGIPPVTAPGSGSSPNPSSGISPSSSDGSTSSPANSKPPNTNGTPTASEKSQLASAIDASEAEAAGDSSAPVVPDLGGPQYSWWDVLLGKHDREIFEHYANAHAAGSDKGKGKGEKSEAEIKADRLKATAMIGREPLMPRFWVLTDHDRSQIVLVIRGTMSLNEIAVDLTCEPEDFEPATTSPSIPEEDEDGYEYDFSLDSEDDFFADEVGGVPASPGLNPITLHAPGKFSFASASGHSHSHSHSYAGRGHGPGSSRMANGNANGYAHANGNANPNAYAYTHPNGDGASMYGQAPPPPRYHVHGGMLRMAKAMGDVGKPVHLAVLEALHCNPEYELILCGHSLGAGVAALLGMMWADPRTCLTVQSSGLPVGRRVSVYCFAPPCFTDASLSKLSSKMITSFVYSHDVVSRLSLGSVRDLKNAALWLCDAEENVGQSSTPRSGSPGATAGNGCARASSTDGRTNASAGASLGAGGEENDAGEGYSAVMSRAKKWNAGAGSSDDPQWFIAVRKSLEANMQMTNMYPPGRVLWAMRDSDLHPAHRVHALRGDPHKLRLFEVLDVENVFEQIVFARDMLTAHMPHQYDRVLHDLL